MKISRKFFKTKRAFIKTLSFFLATMLVLIGLAVSGFQLAYKYRRDLEYSYTRSLNELSDYMSNIEMALNKSIYANTPPQQHGIFSKLIAHTTGAKTALSELPLNIGESEAISRFISQVGDYAFALSEKISKDQDVTEQEIDTLSSFSEYARAINDAIKEIMTLYFGPDKNLFVGDAMKGYTKLTQNAGLSKISSSFQTMNEDTLNDMPTLIYDGPFSDHVTKKESTFLKGKPDVSVEDAKAKAATFLGVPKEQLTSDGETANNNLPNYRFKTGDFEIAITKKGGYVCYLMCSKAEPAKNLSYEDAKKKATQFFAKNNIGPMTESYYIIENNVCIINYASITDDVIEYPDLIKVGVSLGDGRVVKYDATGYLMNHHSRTFDKKSMMKEGEARKKLSKRLQINGDPNVVITPSGGLNEILCYEYLCTGKDNEQVLVYINAKTGYEENIFIIISSDAGTLVM